MGGKAAEKLIQSKLSQHPNNEGVNLSLSKIFDRDLTSIFPKEYGVLPGSEDGSVVGKILAHLTSKGLINSSYAPKYLLGSTRLAAYKVYGEDSVPLSKSETPEIVQQAAKKKTSYGDLDIDVQFTGDKKSIAKAIEEIDPSSFAALVSSEIHLAVKIGDGRVIQIDLVDFSERGDEFGLMQTSSLVDLSQSIKGAFHAMLMWAAVHSMRVSTEEELDAVLDLAEQNPNLEFAQQLQKRRKNGWVPIKTKFSLRPAGLVLSVVVEKKTDKRASYASVPININPKANYKDYDILAQMMLQDDRATKEDILHTLPLANFIRQNKDKNTINEVWEDFLQMVTTRIRDKISPEDYSTGVDSIKSALFGKTINESKLITEAGLGGHLMNLYEDSTLTFKKMLDILSGAAKGKIVGTEKTDGFNIFLSLKDGVPRSARNKGDIKKGGMSLHDLANREFKGGDNIRNIYLAAFSAYDKAVKSFSPEVQDKLFENGRIWYNAEIQGPNEFTTINYDRNAVTIHPRQHLKYDEETQTFETFTDPVLYKFLDKQIDAMEQKITGKNFKLQTTAFMNLKDLSDGSDLKVVKSQIEKELASNGLNSSNTVGDYLFARIYPVIDKQMPEIDKSIKELVTNNIIGRAKLTGPEGLPKGLPRELRKRISAIKKTSRDILKDAIFPIEMAVHDFSVQLLSGLESAYIMNNAREIKRLRGELSGAIKNIKATKDENAINVLVRHLLKIKNVENVDTAIEGFVFDYQGQSYKFTGNFTPINHILNLFRKTKASSEKSEALVGAIREEDDEIVSDVRERIAIFPGSFKPPHLGHYEAAMKLLTDSDADQIYVFISPKERSGHSPENRISITADMSLKIWQIYTKDNPKFVVKIANFPSPTMSAYNLMETSGPDYAYFLGVGEKEDDKRFKDPQVWADKKDLGITIDTIELPSVISGTKMREFIASGDSSQFMQYMPKHLSQEDKALVWNIVNNEKTDANEELINKVIRETFKDFQKKIGKDHTKEKTKLIGTGPQDSGSPFDKESEKKRAKSSPPGFGAIGEKQISERNIEDLADVCYTGGSTHVMQTCKIYSLYPEIEVPKVELIWDKKNGKIGLASSAVKGKMAGKERINPKKLAKMLTAGVFVDVFLANWDVIGTDDGNVVVNKGKATRIDPGGALTFRAQGKKKGSQFSPKAKELQTMLKPGMGAGNVFQYVNLAQAAKVFSSVSWEEIRSELVRINNEEIVPKLKENGMTSLLKEWKKEILHIAKVLKKRHKEVIGHSEFVKKEGEFVNENVNAIFNEKELKLLKDLSKMGSGEVGTNARYILSDIKRNYLEAARSNWKRLIKGNPITLKVIQKYGIKAFIEWSQALASWVDKSEDSSGKILLKNVNIFIEYAGKPTPPKWLFRGMQELNKVPEPEQPIRYSPKRQRAVSWTEDVKVASGFCNNYMYQKGGGFEQATSIVLAIPGTFATKYGKLFLWDIKNKEARRELLDNTPVDSYSLTGEKEWAIWINNPIPVPGIKYCQEKYLGKSAKSRIAQRRVKIKEDDEEQKSGWQRVPLRGNNPMTLSDDGGGLQDPKEIDEISAMSGGAIEGAPGSNRKKKFSGLIREEDKYVISRDDFMEEMILRQKIREAIKFVRHRRLQEKRRRRLDENRIRRHVRSSLQEASDIEDDTPHHSTGINVLEDLLKKIIPILEEDYKNLTTNREQRKSFRSHIVNAIQNSISPDRTRGLAGTEGGEKFIPIGEQDEVPGEEEEVEAVNVKVGPEADEKFIDIDDKPAKGPSKEDKEQEEIDNFGLEGEDKTGRNMALQTYNKIEGSILDSYNLLGDEEDLQLFYDYLLTNLKLYFDKFEDELQTTLNEPTTDEYEQEKDAKADEFDVDSKEPGDDLDDMGGEGEDSLEDIEL